MRAALAFLLSLLPWFPPSAAAGGRDCTVLSDFETGRVLRRDGPCDERASPASTFKVALAVMGYDAGVLRDRATPSWPYREEYGAWMQSWKTDTTPESWMRDSVVWYSWGITRALGAGRFQAAVDALDYGNRDLSGSPGKGDGLTHAWLGTSLAISPIEQVAFLRRLGRGELPVSAESQRRTVEILPVLALPDGWTARGKTGTGFQRGADGATRRDRQLGWYVGWAERDGRRIAFARLVMDEAKVPGAAGPRARDSLAADWPALVGSLR